MAAYDSQGYLAPGFDLATDYQQYQQLQSNPSPLYSASTTSDLTLVGDQFSPPLYNVSDLNPRPAKRLKIAAQGKATKVVTKAKVNNQMPVNDGAVAPAAEVTAAANKPKRVRTGCLTCRERHLKCDEGLPHCLNCRKSSRTCKRGVRLNFIDTQVQSPPMIPPTADWTGMSTFWLVRRVDLC